MTGRLPITVAATLAAAVFLSGCRPQPAATAARAETDKPAVAADARGIHFLGSGNGVVLAWGDIASVEAVRWQHADGSNYLEVSVEHLSGVDFRFQDCYEGYDQVMAAMEERLIGFSRARAEAAQTGDQEHTPVIWKRAEAAQPFQLTPLNEDSRAPTEEERKQMQADRQASIASCERILGRPLEVSEQECVRVDFKNGRIVGSIAAPLSDKLASRQAENPALKRRSR